MRPVQSLSGTRVRTAVFRHGLALLALMAGPAAAIDITVDVLGDPLPNGCTPGDCSLREAVTLANSLAGPDRILLPATPTLPLQLTRAGANENGNATGDLDVLDDLEIIGAGASRTLVVQTTADRLLETTMGPHQRLLLRGLTLQGGRSAFGGALRTASLLTIEDAAFVNNTATEEGGAIAFRGTPAPAIAEARLVLRRVRFEDNAATNGSDFASGGALHATSTFDTAPFVVIEDCDFIDNESTNSGGAVYLTGSVNWFGGRVVVRHSVFRGNRSSGNGGAAMTATSSSFDIAIEDSTFDANVTSGGEAGAAGAINFERVQTSVLTRTTLTANRGSRGGALRVVSTGLSKVVDSDFSGNEAALGGGAVWTGSDFIAERSTFSANRVTSTSAVDDGGGAIGYNGSPTTTLGVTRSTFVDNDAYRGGAISMVTGRLQLYRSTLVAADSGIVGRAGTVLRIREDLQTNFLALGNTILRGTCTFPSVNRQLSRAYHSIESPGNTCRLTTANVSVQNQTDVTVGQLALAPLGDNGGPTRTRLPAATSVAIDQGAESYCSVTDQRRYQRIDALCDIGAVERGATPEDLFRSGFE